MRPNARQKNKVDVVADFAIPTSELRRGRFRCKKSTIFLHDIFTSFDSLKSLIDDVLRRLASKCLCVALREVLLTSEIRSRWSQSTTTSWIMPQFGIRLASSSIYRLIASYLPGYCSDAGCDNKCPSTARLIHCMQTRTWTSRSSIAASQYTLELP